MQSVEVFYARVAICWRYFGQHRHRARLDCCLSGLLLTLCLPANANEEQKRTLRAHGVEVIDPLEGSDGVCRAQALAAEEPDQYVYWINIQ